MNKETNESTTPNMMSGGLNRKHIFPVLVRQQVLREHLEFHGLGMTIWLDGDQLDKWLEQSLITAFIYIFFEWNIIIFSCPAWWTQESGQGPLVYF